MAETTQSNKTKSKKAKLTQSSVQPTQRLSSLDAYRGFTMILLAATGFGLAATAQKFIKDATGAEPPVDTSFWEWVHYMFSHVKWGFLPDIHHRWDFKHWITFWDMIQPSFMFMVGVSMPFSYMSRKKKGHSYLRMFAHAAWRAVVLVLLGVFLRSLGRENTNWFFMDVVAQIGLGYIFLFLLWNKGWKIQIAGFVIILIGYWSWFAFSPLPTKDFDYSTVSVPAPPTIIDAETATEEEKKAYAEKRKEYELTTLQYSGFEAHWNKHTNPAQKFDLWFMNLFPQKQRGKQYEGIKQEDGTTKWKFRYNAGGYQVLNFIPSLATMLLGLMAGTLLQDDKETAGRKLLILFSGGLLCLVIGKGLDIMGFCPIVKIIWTPTWVLWSGGFCLWILASFYLVMDVIGFRFWAFPAVVVGMNSIAIYVMEWTMKTPVKNFMKTHFGGNLSTLYGRVSEPYSQMVIPTLVFVAFWIILFWMYRNKFFIRV